MCAESREEETGRMRVRGVKNVVRSGISASLGRAGRREWEQEEGGWESEKREVVKECALFIPADTPQSLIHLEKGISQVTAHRSAFMHMHTHKPVIPKKGQLK